MQFMPTTMTSAVSLPTTAPTGRTGVFRRLALLALALGWVAPVASQTAYDGFHAPDGINAGTAIGPVALQPDGKVLISGVFQHIGGDERFRHVARLHPDGSLDRTFTYGGYDGLFNAVSAQADGQILVAGSVWGGGAGGFVGLVDAYGAPVVFADPQDIDAEVNAAIVQPDGKVLIAGAFTTVHGQTRSRIARLNADGSVDDGFDPGAGPNDTVTDIALQPDGKLLIAGAFTAADGQPRNRIARLNGDGSLDVAFDSAVGANGTVNTIALQPDGKVVLAGNFTAVGHSARNRIARLSADGTVDSTFHPGAGPDGRVSRVAVAADGKVLVAGAFLTFDGRPRARIARLHPDGRLDDSSSINAAAASRYGADYDFRLAGPDQPVDHMALQPDGKVLISGRFEQIDNRPFRNVARINADGTVDDDMDFGQRIVNDAGIWGIQAVAMQPDGKIILSGGFAEVHHVARRGIARLNTDGTLDLDFDPGTGVGTDWSPDPSMAGLSGAAVQPDGKLLIWGGPNFDSFNGVPRPGIGRLHADGAVDLQFVPDATVSQADGALLQSDGKVVVAGTASLAGVDHFLFRLHTDGSLDAGFDASRSFDKRCFDGTWTDCWVGSMALQLDGKTLVGVQYLETPSTPVWHRLDRLNADGSLDTGFTVGSGAGGANVDAAIVLMPQPDGKILVSGSTSIGGQAIPGIARLNADGSLDAGFAVNLGSGGVNLSSLQADGKIIVRSAAHNTIVDGVPIALIARLNANGSLDTVFGFDPPRGPDNFVHASTLQSDGKIPLFGQFTSIEGPWPACCERLARLSTPQAALQHLRFDRDHNRIEWLRSGIGPEFAHVGFEMSVDGSDWFPLGPGELIHGGPVPGPDDGRIWSHSKHAGGYSAGLMPTTSPPAAWPPELVRTGPTPSFSNLAAAAGAATPSTAAGKSSYRYTRAARYTTASGFSDLGSYARPTKAGTGTVHYLVTATGGTPQNTTAGTPFLTPLSVRVTDVDGVAAPDVQIAFFGPPSGGSDPAALLSPTTATTDGNGEASVTAIANAHVGSYVLEAFVLGAVTDVPAYFDLTQTEVGASGDLRIAATGGTPQSAVISEPFTAPLAVRVTDEDDLPVENVAVNFYVPLEGASAVLSSSTATTDANGEASVTATANGTLGDYVAVAYSSGASAGFELANTRTTKGKIVISQVWGGGGGAGAPYTHDFVELFNAGEEPVDLTNWTLRFYAGSQWRSTTLTSTNHILQPGQYYLVQLGFSGSAGVPLPTPDRVGPTGATTGNLNPTVGKIALVGPGATFTGVCPNVPEIADLVGYGSTIDCAWVAPTTVAQASVAALRADQGCRQTGRNSLDFVGGAPQPRNSASPLNPCVGGVDLRIARTSSGSQSAAVLQPFAAPLAVRVTDDDGNAVAGEEVTFVVPITGASATLSAVTVTTDGNGEAEVSAVANSIPGSYLVRAFNAHSGPPAQFMLTNTLNLQIVGGTPQAATVNQPFAEALKVRVTSSDGSPVANVLLDFSGPANGPGAALSSATATTDAQGEASVTATANRWVGSYTITAKIGLAQVGFDLSNSAPAEGPRVVISQILGNSVNPYPHQFIELFNAGTEPQILEGWSVQTARTATWNVISLPTTVLFPGQHYLIQTDGEGALLPVPDLIRPALNASVKVALVESSAALTSACPNDPSIVDFVGNSVNGCAWGTPIPTSSAPAVARKGNGCINTGNNAADFEGQEPQPRNGASPRQPCDGSGVEVVMTVTGGNGQSAGLNRNFATPLRVRLTDGAGAPMSNIAVSFVAPAQGTSAALSASTAVTNGNGEASVTATANAVSGSYIVQAGIGTVAPVNFHLTNDGQLAVAYGNHQSTPVGSAFGGITVRLVGNGQPLSNIPVSFSAPAGGASAAVSSATVVTDSDGNARITATANLIAGSFAITASIAGSAPPASIELTNLADGEVVRPWSGWSVDDVNLPRNRNVWIRARGSAADGSSHESTQVFYPTGGYTATPAAGSGGRIEPSIPQGGEAGEVLSFTIVPDEGYGIVSVTGCDGSLNGSTYLTGPLSADCEIVASFAGDVETFTVTSSAGPGGAIEPEGPQPAPEGETVSFVLLPDPEHVIDGVGGTCGGELVGDVYTTVPITADCTVQAAFEPDPLGDRLFADGFEGEATIH